jgi:hypothetical protein
MFVVVMTGTSDGFVCVTEVGMDDPQVVSRDEWLAARRQLLAKEKEFTRQRDALNAERRGLPMVEVDKEYVFEGTDGRASLLDLFEDRGQLLIYHFMFDPDWDEGCPSCSFLADNIGHLAHLHARDTTLVLASRAPLAARPRAGRLPRHHRPGSAPGGIGWAADQAGRNPRVLRAGRDGYRDRSRAARDRPGRRSSGEYRRRRQCRGVSPPQLIENLLDSPRRCIDC